MFSARASSFNTLSHYGEPDCNAVVVGPGPQKEKEMTRAGPAQSTKEQEQRLSLQDLVGLSLSVMLGDTSDTLPKDSSMITLFHSICKPNVSIGNYMARVVKITRASGEAALLSVLYMNRIVKQETLINVDSLTVHRLLLASLIVAAKFLDDTVASNRTWAYAGGLSVKELNSLEIRFLELISFDLYVELSDFECTKARLAKIADEKARFAGVGFDKALAAESAMCESCAYSPSPSFLCNFRDTICFHDPTP